MTSFLIIFRNFLLLYILCSFRRCDGQKSLSARCQLLGGHELKRICTGSYPQDVKRKYLDKYVKPGLSYTVFGLDGYEGYYLISHGYSDLTKCDGVSANSARDFDCSGRTVHFRTAILRCLPFHTDITDDLISHCSKGKKWPLAEFTAMHYVDGITLYEDLEISKGFSRITYFSLFIFIPFIVMQLM